MIEALPALGRSEDSAKERRGNLRSLVLARHSIPVLLAFLVAGAATLCSLSPLALAQGQQLSVISIPPGLPQTGLLPTVIRTIAPVVQDSLRKETIQQVTPAVALTSRASPPTETAQFERVPKDGANGSYVAGAETILSQLLLLDKDIEVSTPTLSPEEKDALVSARKLLYLEGIPPLKSAAYSRYLDFAEKYDEATRRYKQATNAAERTNVQLQIRTLEQDWETYGQRSKISHAIDTVTRFGSDNIERLHKAWQQTLESGSIGTYDRLWDIVSGTSDWTSVTIPISPQQLRSTELSAFVGKEMQRAVQVTGLTQISMKVRTFRVPRPAFDHPFLRSPNWRNTKSYVLSDGGPQSSAAELVPRLVTALVLAKGIELTFSSIDAWNPIAEAVDKNATVRLGGIPIKQQGLPSAYLAPKYVSLAPTYVIAVLVERLPKIPNTDPTDTWPPWWKK